MPEPPTVTPSPAAPATPARPAPQAVETPAPAVAGGIVVVLGNDLAVIAPDGTGLRRLGLPGGDPHTPRWSPDGTRIAYDEGSGGDADLWLVNADGTGAHALTHTPGVQEEDPRWSPDGRTLAYTRAADTNGDGRYDAADLREVWLAGLDGTAPHRLADGMDVAWAPDGLRLAFATNGQRAGTPYGANNTIDMINAQGQNRWSPLKIPNIPQDTSLVDPQAQFNAATVFLRYPAWAPGNHTVAFIADGHSGLVVTATDKGANPTLRDFAYEGGMGPVAWSPDGTRLLYQILPASGIHEVGVLGLANHVKQIFGSAHDGTEADSAVWAPDGAHIAYIQNGVRPSSGASPAGALVVAPVNAPGQPLPILPAGAADPDWH